MSFFFFLFSSTRGCKIKRFFESHGCEILGVFDFHGGKILGLKKSYGCKKKKSAAEAGRKILAFFFWCKIKISVGKYFFFDLSGSEIFDISYDLTLFQFKPFWPLFDPSSLVVSSPWWQALEFKRSSWGFVGAFSGHLGRLDVI